MNLHPMRLTSAAALTLLLTACGGGLESNRAQPSQSEDLVKAQVAHPSEKYPDHHEFEAVFEVPFTAANASGARRFTVHMHYPGAPEGQLFAYRVELLSKSGHLVKAFHGVETYQGKPVVVGVDWEGARGLAEGLYEARLTAFDADADQMPTEGDAAARYTALASAHRHAHGPVVQSWEFVVGRVPKVAMPTMQAMPVGAAGEAETRRKVRSAPAHSSWPYTVYFGSLHGQTNDSDGGGGIASCSSSQPAQTGPDGVDVAFPYAKSRGLDFFANTDHNHYYDGSSGTNTSADPVAARARFQSSRQTALNYTAANPGFLAMHGLEWGVISNGGHLNIFNVDQLLAWEYTAANELIGDVFTAKTDYAALYTLMRSRGWVGQFNHPDSTGQFVVNGVSLAYTADGDEVMALAEISNTSAFSNVTDESQLPGSGYEAAFKILLENGYHVAPATNQDNHCSNWGASYTNRTAVLIPTGTPLSQASFLEALRARRVFATHDKNSQLIFSANGNVMGSRINNSGALNLNIGYYNGVGRSVASVEIWEGVPGRAGTPTVVATTPTATITPSQGAHYYYARVTQDDGKVLWSAPIWVNQGAGGGDTTPPTVSASVTGTSGSLTLNATASDDVGVTKVEFWVDGALKGSDTTSPYSLGFDSTQVANGTHTLTAKAFDAAGNSASSSVVSFSVNNASATLAETESNNTIATANTVTTQTTVTGFIASSTDKDYFKLSLKANQKVRVDMTGPAGVDYDLYLVNGSGAGLASSEGTTASESLTYTNGTTAKTVYIKVQSYSGSSTTQGYKLTISYP